jgi:hypothetical protein
MTFRHLRSGGNVLEKGTNRISTARELEAFKTLLQERGTGELARVDVNAARRLGAEFIEHGDIMGHLEQIERDIVAELKAANEAGRAKNFIARLEKRLNACRKAREFAQAYLEGQGVERIPSRAITRVKGSNIAEAVAGEQAFLKGVRFFRYGGRVLVIVGAGMSIHRIASAPPELQGRVATQELGGWALSLAGASLGSKAGAGIGALLGIETGPGAVITAAFGALVGGAIGFFGGEAAANELYDVGENTSRLLSDTPRLMETTTLMFGTAEDRRKYYELREIETGEPPVGEGF